MCVLGLYGTAGLILAPGQGKSLVRSPVRDAPIDREARVTRAVVRPRLRLRRCPRATGTDIARSDQTTPLARCEIGAVRDHRRGNECGRLRGSGRLRSRRCGRLRRRVRCAWRCARRIAARAGSTCVLSLGRRRRCGRICRDRRRSARGSRSRLGRRGRRGGRALRGRRLRRGLSVLGAASGQNRRRHATRDENRDGGCGHGDDLASAGHGFLAVIMVGLR